MPDSVQNKQNPFFKIAWGFLFILFYPILTTFSLLFMGILWFFSTISKFLARVSTSKSTVFELKKPEWKAFASVNDVKVAQIYVDDILFGPNYYKLKATPEILGLEDDIYGSFKFVCFDGVLLQKWNSINYKDLPDFTLVYLDCKNLKTKELSKINSFDWNASIDSGIVTIKWFNGSEGGEMKLKEEDVA